MAIAAREVLHRADLAVERSGERGQRFSHLGNPREPGPRA